MERLTVDSLRHAVNVVQPLILYDDMHATAQ
jgi:hypothetical protein